MPGPLTIPLIGAATQIAGSTINSASTARQNKKSRQWSEKMYDQQKADNLANWNRENDYNSPLSMMNRFKDAGLAPQLAYGAGNGGNAGSVATPDVQKPEFRSPEWGNAASGGFTGFMDAMYNLEIKQAQIDNLNKDLQVKDAQAGLVASQTQRSKFDYDFETDMRDVSADARREDLRAKEIGNKYILHKNEREWIMSSRNYAESIEKVLTSRAQRAVSEQERQKGIENVKLLKKEGVLKDLHIKLRAKGLEPNSSQTLKIISRIIDLLEKNKNNTIPQMMQKGTGMLDKLFDYLSPETDRQKSLRRRRNAYGIK